MDYGYGGGLNIDIIVVVVVFEGSGHILFSFGGDSTIIVIVVVAIRTNSTSPASHLFPFPQKDLVNILNGLFDITVDGTTVVDVLFACILFVVITAVVVDPIAVAIIVIATSIPTPEFVMLSTSRGLPSCVGRRSIQMHHWILVLALQQ